MELVQNKEGLVATLTVKISQEDYATKVEKELKKARQTLQVKGFRPGNAPISLIKRLYGQSALVDEINKLLTEVIGNYEKENSDHIMIQIIPSDKNNISDISDQTDFEFEYFVGFYPEFTYQLNENTVLPYYNIFFEDTEIDDEIQRLLKVYKTYENLEEVEDKCIISANIELEKDGKVLYDKLISTSVIPDEYKSVFNGAKIKDVLNVEIRKVFTNEVDLMGLLEVDKETLDLLPETLPFTVLEISKEKQSEVNQEFFDKISGGKDILHSEEEFREYIRKHIVSEYENLSLNKLYDDSIEILTEKANITLPEDFMKKYIRYAQKNDALKISEESFDSVVASFIQTTKWSYIVDSLFKQADIRITTEEIKIEAIKLVMEQYGNGINLYVEQLAAQYLKSEEGIKYVVERLRIQKLARLLKNNAKLNVIDILNNDFYKLYESNIKSVQEVNEQKIQEQEPETNDQE
jgi:trigger factor